MGFPPIIVTSFIVPAAASTPMSPPGKKMGSTVCESELTIKVKSPERGIVAPSSNSSTPIPLSMDLVL